MISEPWFSKGDTVFEITIDSHWHLKIKQLKIYSVERYEYKRRDWIYLSDDMCLVSENDLFDTKENAIRFLTERIKIWTQDIQNLISTTTNSAEEMTYDRV